MRDTTANISGPAGRTPENWATRFGRIFGDISGTIKWVTLLGIFIILLYFGRHHINAVY